MLSGWRSPRTNHRAAQPGSRTRRQTLFLVLCNAVKGIATGKSSEPIKPRKPFKFRYFEVFQDACAMKVGTDAMLLGSWAQPLPGGCGASSHLPPGTPGSSPASAGRPDPSASASGSGSKPAAAVRVLDVGTGTGVLALMMAQKLAAADGAAVGGEGAGARGAEGAEGAGAGAGGSGDSGAGAAGAGVSAAEATAASQRGETAAVAEATGGVLGWQQQWPQVVAIDVDEPAVLQARENVGLSPWADRIRVLHVGLQQLAAAAAALAQQPAAAASAPSVPVPVPVPAPASDDAAEQQPQQKHQQSGTQHAAAGRDPAPTGSAACGAAAAAEASLASSATTAVVTSNTPATTTTSSSSSSSSTAATAGSTATHITAADVGPFDLIITNPPYFVASSKPAQGRAARAAARHADVALPFPDLAAGCEALLAPGGAVCVVLPPPEADSFRAAAACCGLVLTELVHVFTGAEDGRPRRHLMRLQRAADLFSSTASPPPEPLITRLVINGPKRSTTAGGSSSSSSNGSSTGASRDGSSSEGEDGAAAAVTSRVNGAATADAPSLPPPGLAPAPARPGPARPLTAQYRRLTRDFHDPAFLALSAEEEEGEEQEYAT